MLIPSDFPIQFFWATFTFSDQSRLKEFSSSFSAYAVILKNHCSNNLFTTIFPHLSHFPFAPDVPVGNTCSSANTVLQLGQKFTSELPRYAKPLLNI